MKPGSLHALIIDRHCGELSPEAAELLELHLARDAAARAEAERILQSLAVTRDAVLRHPELARVAPMDKPALPRQRWPRLSPWLSRAAAAVLLATLAGAAGFVAGRSESPAVAARRTLAAEMIPPAPPRKESPWARYRMTFDPAGEGMQVVRLDTANLEQKATP